MLQVGGTSEVWQVRMLGGLQVVRGKAAAEFRTKKTASLFAYLAFTAGRDVSKDVLVDTFWPEADLDRGRGSLRTALSALRTSLQPADKTWQVFETGLSSIRLNVDYFSVDALEFARISREGTSLSDLIQAFDLYRGPLLQGYHEPWIVPQALDLEETYVLLTRKLVDQFLAANDIDSAVATARRALTVCPEREELHIAQMLAYNRAGMSSAVIRQFEQLETMLDDLWGERPSEEALQLLNNEPVQTGRSPDHRQEPELTLAPEVRIPTQTGGFFGRSDEVASLVDMLGPGKQQARLVTLTGLGGCGKTRLAEAVAFALDSDFSHRIWLVQLAPIRHASQVLEAVAARVQSNEASNDDVVQSLSRLLGTQPAMIVLDNLEHLLPGLRNPLLTLVTALPNVTFLATSRIPAGVPDERVCPVGPLPCPEPNDSLEAIRSSPSAQLLVEAAQTVRPGFEIRPVNARAVAELCRKVEGVPLALRLAASRLAQQTPAQVLGSIARRIDLAHPSFEPRQSSLKTVVGWHVDLLDSPTRVDLAKLSVCHDGVGHSLAREILGARTDDSLSELVRTALLSWTETEVELRYSMLEAVREVAADYLAGEGRLEDEAKSMHFNYCFSLCCPRDRGRSIEDWLATVEPDIGNIVAALDPEENPALDPQRAWTMLECLQDYVWRKGRIQTFADSAIALLEATESRLSLESAVKANQVTAALCYGLRDIARTFAYSRRALDLADATTDKVLQVTARVDLAIPATLLGKFDEAKAWLKQGLEKLEQGGAPSLKARCLLSLAWCLFDGGDEEAARPVFQQSVLTAESAEDESVLASCLVGFAVSMFSDVAESERHFDRAETIRRRQAHMERIGHCLYYRAYAAYRRGTWEVALDFAEQAFRVFREGGVRLGQVPLTIVGNVLAASGRGSEAALLWGRSEDARVRHGMLMFPLLKAEFEREERNVLKNLSRADLLQRRKTGAGMTDDELIDLVFDRQK